LSGRIPLGNKNFLSKDHKGEIAIYRDEEGNTVLDVTLEGQSVWLSLNQMVTLFKRDKSVISRHLNNVFKSKELDRDSVVAFFATTAADRKTYQVEYFNLDAIISVGYRVNSKRGTQFRIWATNVLHDHLVTGYTINERRLKEEEQRLKELSAAVELVEKAKSTKALSSSETSGLLTVITEYTRSWLLLHQYDEGTLGSKGFRRTARFRLTEEDAKMAIDHLRSSLMKRREAGSLFGQEKEHGTLKGIIGSIDQTFGGMDLYSSIEEKAANLFYFLIKDHPFADGNKRIASLLFIWFLEQNGILSSSRGVRKINDNALVALTLLVAESNPKQKEIMTKLIISLISEK
jgi:prophage maintenance system killer protein